jgi:hypothetical protein
MCIRKGAVMTTNYIPPEDFEDLGGRESMTVYQFGDRCLDHCFCATCGVAPFSAVVSLPAGYNGPARPGYYRVNLGCVHDLDVYSLEISVIDGKSF